MRVLIADDDAASRRLMRRIVEGMGHSCEEASGGRALERLGGTNESDAVISDVDLGDGDGVGICSRLRRRRPELPVVMVTGDPGSAVRARECGFIEVLEKPFSREDLTEALRRVLSSRRGA